MRDLPPPEPGTPDDRSATRYLVWLAGRTRPSVAAAVFFAVLWMLCQAVVPAVVGRAIDAGLTRHDQQQLVAWGLVLLGIGFVQAVAGIMRHRNAVFVWLSAAFRTIQVAVRQSGRLGVALPRRMDAGKVVAIGTADIGHIGNAIDITARGIGSIVAVLAVTGILLATSVPLGLVVVIGIPLLTAVVSLLIRPLHRRQQEYREQQGILTGRAADLVGGLRVLRGVGGEPVMSRHYREGSQDLRTAGLRVARVEGLLDAAQVLVPGIFLVLVTWLGARFAMSGRITVGQLVSFYGYAAFLVSPLRQLTETVDKMTRGHVSARRVVDLLRVTSDIEESPKMGINPDRGGRERGRLGLSDGSARGGRRQPGRRDLGEPAHGSLRETGPGEPAHGVLREPARGELAQGVSREPGRGWRGFGDGEWFASGRRVLVGPGRGELPSFGRGKLPDPGHGELSDSGRGELPDPGLELPDPGLGEWADQGRGEPGDLGHGKPGEFGRGEPGDLGHGKPGEFGHGELVDPVSGVVVQPGRVTVIAAALPADAVAIADRLGRYGADGDGTLLGGVPLRDFDLAGVRELIVIADNDARLFSGPLRADLDPEGTGRAEEALVAAAATEVVRELPDGLDSVVAERGRSFSGGQQQRLRLARALVADPAILVLVEPTSAVDAHTEARIAERLGRARQGRTTVVCSTSPLVLDRADHVVYVEDGRAVAEGTHRELLDGSLAYARTVLRE